KGQEQAKVIAQIQRENQNLQAQVNLAQAKIMDSTQQLAEYNRWFFRATLAVVVLGLLAVGIGALIIGLRRLSSDGPWATPYLITAGSVLLLLFLGSLGGTFFLMNRGLEDHRDMDVVAAKQAAPGFGGGGGMPPDMAAEGAPMAND